MTARRSLLIALALLAAATGLLFAVGRLTRGDRAEAACPPGFTTDAQRARMHEREKRFEALGREAGKDQGEAAEHRREAEGDAEGEGGRGCQPLKHPESLGDIAAVNAF